MSPQVFVLTLNRAGKNQPSMLPNELTISLAEHKSRIEQIRRQLKRSRIDALYLTNPTRILYSTGFAYISTERPLAVVIPQEAPIFLLGPELENDHVREGSRIIDEIYTYPDYPGRIHPMRHFTKFMIKRGLAESRIATDSMDGAAGGWGYKGPSLRDLMPRAKFIDGRGIVDRLRLVKSRQEIRLLRESSKWSEIAHDVLLETVKPGSHDVLLAMKASCEALGKMLRKLGNRYRQLKGGLSPVVVGFRGQIGAGSAIPHAVYTKNKIRRGDVLVTEAGVEIGGYTSELERTVVVGKPSSKVRKYFETMLSARSAALKELRPGAPCHRIDEAARMTVEKFGLSGSLRHHTGHGIGLDGHEPPWLDPGDRTIIREGMVFSCEPGLYVPGYAGFRHSDTVVITRRGMDFMTRYPTDLESLTI